MRPARRLICSRLTAYLALVILSLGGVQGCRSRGWNRVDLQTMQRIMGEMAMAEASFSEQGLSDSLRIIGYQTLLARYDITLQDWDSSLVWYSTHELENYTKIYEYASADLTNRQTLLKRRIDSLDNIQDRLRRWYAGDLDSVNLLRDSISYYPAGSYVERTFEYTPNMDYGGGTRITFAVRVHGQGAKGSKPLNLSLHIALTDSTQLSKLLTLSRSGLHELTIELPEGKSMRTAYGSLRGFAPTAKGQLLAVDSFSFARYKSLTPEAPAEEEVLSVGEKENTPEPL